MGESKSMVVIAIIELVVFTAVLAGLWMYLGTPTVAAAAAVAYSYIVTPQVHGAAWMLVWWGVAIALCGLGVFGAGGYY